MLVFATSTSTLAGVEWLDCATAPNHALHNFTYHGRKAWRQPPIDRLCCFPQHKRCFRAVLDDAVTLDEGIWVAQGEPARSTYLSDKPDLPCKAWAASQPSECSKNPKFMQENCALSCAGELPPTRNDSHTLDVRLSARVQDSLVTQIRALLEADFGVTDIELSSRRPKAYFPVNFSSSEVDNGGSPVSESWFELHSDYYENAGYVFSAVREYIIEPFLLTCMIRDGH